MKTINILLISALFTNIIPTFTTSYNINDKSNSTQSSEQLIFDYIVIPRNELIGTKFEGHTIEIKSGIAYMDGKSIIGTILVFIGGIVAGYLVDGVLLYTTGYSGGELVAQGLASLNAFCNRNANLKTVYLDNRYSTSVRSYITKSGQQCTLNNSGSSYNCAYSI